MTAQISIRDAMKSHNEFRVTGSEVNAGQHHVCVCVCVLSFEGNGQSVHC